MEPGPSGLKRKRSTDEPGTSKCMRSDSPSIPPSHVNILQFSDCVLLKILMFLDATGLYQLGKTCKRFTNLVQDESLWINVDARRPPNNFEKTKYCWQHVNRKTKRIFTAAQQRCQMGFTLTRLIKAKDLDNLKVLALENQTIRHCKLSEFPRTLEELSLRNSYVAKHLAFLGCSFETMQNLKVLVMDRCQWVDCNCLVPVSKFPKLEILSLYMCKKLHNDEVATLSVIGHYGFKTLKVLDVRFTGLGCQVVRSFCRNTSLQSLYYQNFITSYYTERYERKLDIMSGSKMEENSYISDDEDLDNRSKGILYRRFSDGVLETQAHTISNDIAREFRKLTASQELHDMPEPTSVLYKKPYNTCTCGFMSPDGYARIAYLGSDVDWIDPETLVIKSDNSDRTTVMKKLKSEKDEQDTHKIMRFKPTELYYFQEKSAKFLLSDSCSDYTFDSCLLPKWPQVQATPGNCTMEWVPLREPRNDYEIRIVENTLTTKCHVRREKLHNIKPSENIYPMVSALETCLEGIREGSAPNLEALLDSLDLTVTCDDADFLKRLENVLTKLATDIAQDLELVLRSHRNCFEGILSEFSKSETKRRQQLLLDFLENMFYKETGTDHTIEFRNEGTDECLPSTSTSNKTVQTEDDLPGGSIIITMPNDNSQLWTRFQLAHFPHIQIDELDVPTVSGIKELSLRGYVLITGKLLQGVRQMELNILDVTGTNVTRDDIKEFLHYNPRCRVLHKTACVCRPNLHF